MNINNFKCVACSKRWPHPGVAEASRKYPVKTRLINQFLLSVYMKSAGMLPDKSLGGKGEFRFICFLGLGGVVREWLSWSACLRSPDVAPMLCLFFMGWLNPRFCRSGRPRKLQPEKLTVVLEDQSRCVSDDEGILGWVSICTISGRQRHPMNCLGVSSKVVKSLRMKLRTYRCLLNLWKRTRNWRCTCLVQIPFLPSLYPSVSSLPSNKRQKEIDTGCAVNLTVCNDVFQIINKPRLIMHTLNVQLFCVLVTVSWFVWYPSFPFSAQGDRNQLLKYCEITSSTMVAPG